MAILHHLTKQLWDVEVVCRRWPLILSIMFVEDRDISWVESISGQHGRQCLKQSAMASHAAEVETHVGHLVLPLLSLLLHLLAQPPLKVLHARHIFE